MDTNKRFINSVVQHFNHLELKNQQLEQSIAQMKQHQQIVLKVLNYQSWEQLIHSFTNILNKTYNTSSNLYQSSLISQLSYESPIESQIRLCQKTIRGQTPNHIHKQLISTDTQVTSYKLIEEENFLLAVENTKLRRKIALLEKAVSSQIN